MAVIVVLGFVVIFAAILISVSVGTKFYETRRRRHVTDMLQTVAGPTVATTTKLLKDLEPSQPSGIDRLLKSLDFTRRATELIAQAGLDWTPNSLLGAMAMAAVVGVVGGFLVPDIVGRAINCMVLGALGAWLPYLFLRQKKNKRMAEMEEQLPEALDFLARSMRAGHAFTISLEMLGNELRDPLGQEFRTLFNEQNLGAPIDVALQNFSTRVPLLDVRFFSSSVLLQRQTGGNLSEILTRLAYLIRERFRLKGQVRASSAHGRMTATVLTLMPVLTMTGLMAVSPGYLKGMAKDSDGRLMIGGAIFAMMLGNYSIRKIVNIKV